MKNDCPNIEWQGPSIPYHVLEFSEELEFTLPSVQNIVDLQRRLSDSIANTPFIEPLDKKPNEEKRDSHTTEGHPCTCDFATVIMVTGCKCGGA
jgi:hypothetical protein